MTSLRERAQQIRQLQPDLHITSTNDQYIQFTGVYHLIYDDEIIHSFQSRLKIYESKLQEPEFWLTEEHFPFEIDRHIYSSGQCCLEIWEHWLWKNPDYTSKQLIDILIGNFLIGQLYYDRHGRFPFDDWRHGRPGIGDAFREILGLEDGASTDEMLRELDEIILTKSRNDISVELAMMMRRKLIDLRDAFRLKRIQTIRRKLFASTAIHSFLHK